MEKTKNIKKLISEYHRTQIVIGSLKNDLQYANSALDQVHKLLVIPKKINNDINELYDLLVALSLALDALSDIPFVGPEARTINFEIKAVIDFMKPIKQEVNRIESEIRPYDNKIIKIEKYIQDILKPLNEVDQYLNQQESLLSSSLSNTSNLNHGVYKHHLTENLNGLSGDIIQIMKIPVELLEKITVFIGDITHLMKEGAKVAKMIEKVAKPILIMSTELDRIGGVIKAIKKALEKKLTINLGLLHFSFSIESILKGLEDIPGLSELTAIAKDILKPILKKLFLGVKGIPGMNQTCGQFDQLIKKLTRMETIFNQIEEKFTSLFTNQSPIKNIEALEYT